MIGISIPIQWRAASSRSTPGRLSREKRDSAMPIAVTRALTRNRDLAFERLNQMEGVREQEEEQEEG